MQRYFAHSKNKAYITLSENDIHHLKKVVKYKPLDKVEIVYGNELYLGTINSDYSITIDRRLLAINSIMNVTIGCCLIKEQKWNYLLQKATECQVSAILPITSERSIIKITNDDVIKKLNRWCNVLKSASEQSKRIDIPIIYDIINIRELKINEYDYCFVMDPNGTPIKKVIKPLLRDKKFLILFGPEGGFSNAEKAYLEELGATIVSMGESIYRAETAPIVALSMIKYHFME